MVTRGRAFEVTAVEARGRDAVEEPVDMGSAESETADGAMAASVRIPEQSGESATGGRGASPGSGAKASPSEAADAVAIQETATSGSPTVIAENAATATSAPVNAVIDEADPSSGRKDPAPEAVDPSEASTSTRPETAVETSDPPVSTALAVPEQAERSSVLAAEADPGQTATEPAPEVHKGPPLRGVALGGMANLAGAAVSGAAGLVITWLVAAALGPAGAGLFFAATSAFLIAISLSRLGTPTGLVYWIARLRAAGAPGAVRDPLRIALTPVVAVSLVLGVVGFLGAPAIADAYGPDPSQAEEYARLLRLLSVFIPAGTILDALLAASRGLSTMKPTVWVERLGRTLAQLALLGFAVLLSTTDTAPDWVTFAWALPYVPAVAAAWWWLRKRMPARAPGTSPALTPAKFWQYTGPRALASVAQFALQRLDILLVAGLLGFAAAALYTVATRFVIAGQLANVAVGSSLQPRIAAALSIKDVATARRLYRHTTTWIILLSWPMYLSAAVLAPEYLSLFGAEYRTDVAVVVVRVLAAAMLVGSACGTVDTVLAMSGRTSWQLSNVLLALIANVSIDLWLIPRIGIVGAGIGWAAAVLANNLVPLAQLGLAERLHPFGRQSVLAMAAAATCFGVLPALSGAVLGDGTRLPVAICGGLVYAGLLWRSRGPLLTRHLK